MPGTSPERSVFRIGGSVMRPPSTTSVHDAIRPVHQSSEVSEGIEMENIGARAQGQ